MTALLDDRVRYLTDSGLETTLVFLDGMDLPAFAAFPMLDDPAGRKRLASYYREHADLAAAHGMGFVFEAPTWRANTDWAARIGYDQPAVDRVNRDAVAFLRAIEAQYGAIPTLVSGQMGPRGDGYVPDGAITADAAAQYHGRQIAALSGADMVSALTLNYVEEAVGVALAAREARMPAVISFTTETDGRLPSGQGLAEAIEEVDARTDGWVAYYMVNCAHPEHFAGALGGPATARIRGIRANASRCSHAELDASETLDIGDPLELAADYAALAGTLPGLAVFGGCCGTDIRHIRTIAATIAPATQERRA